MLLLPNGCRCSEPKISKTARGWKIYYRFHDTSYTHPHYEEIKAGINHIKNLPDRLAVCKVLMEEEVKKLRSGFNPRTRTFLDETSLHPYTPFVQALGMALDSLDATAHTKEDIRSTVHYVSLAAEALRYDLLPVESIRRKHIKTILNKLADLKPTLDVVVKNKAGAQRKIRKAEWSNNQYNTYRKNLSILFEELMEQEATEVNAAQGIKRKKHAAKKREVLTKEQCLRVDAFAMGYDIHLWKLIHIFYHSGSRTTEIFKVQGKHVNLDKQSVKYLVLKGRNYEWIERPIVDEALPFWQMAMQGCGNDDYVFSVGLVPGPKAIRPEQISRRWRRHIKEKLGIAVDFYALKHLNITVNIEQVFAEIKEAQLLATSITGHKSEKMIAKVYDIHSAKRLNETLKKQSKKFG